jgi:hypothetical protein
MQTFSASTIVEFNWFLSATKTFHWPQTFITMTEENTTGVFEQIKR